MKGYVPSVLIFLAAGSVASASAQSTVAEVLEKGGKALGKAEFAEMMPMRVQFKWPNRQGEEDLVLSVDGKISGTGHHYASRTDSPAVGQWKSEDDGKVCTPKTFTAWNSSTNNCWYFYKLGEEFFGAAKNEADSRVAKFSATAKVVTSQ